MKPKPKTCDFEYWSKESKGMRKCGEVAKFKVLKHRQFLCEECAEVVPINKSDLGVI